MVIKPEELSVSSNFDMVVFGGSGDLAMRKLLPALYYCQKNRQLPAGRIIGVSRGDLTRADYLDKIDRNFRRFIPAQDLTPFDWQAFQERLDYRRVDAMTADDYRLLSQLLKDSEDRVRVFYLATAPDLFSIICEHLAQAGLVTAQARVVLEKPLGHSLTSAQQINKQVGAVFAEHQIYRIDHYLAKETVQNLMVLRFGNPFFEPLWRSKWISHVQITVAEQLGIEGRGKYYDRAGALRDVVQNHLLQLLCLLAMEPPNSIDPDAIRDEKLKILRALRPLSPEAIKGIVRGQYRAGAINGVPVPGYLQEPAVELDSRTETFVALRAEIGSWRWAGVPFFLRTGKRLQEKVSELVVYFREVPHCIFEPAFGAIEPNHLVIRLQPDESIKLFLMAKTPGDEMKLRPVHLNLNFAKTFRTRQPDAYERLLMDIIRGKLTLFMRHDEQDAAWRWIEPILNAWEATRDGPKPYTAGSWGPAASTALISRDGFLWYEEGG